MPTGVRHAVEAVLTELNTDWSSEDAERYITGMEASGRWMEETW